MKCSVENLQISWEKNIDQTENQEEEIKGKGLT